MKAKGMNLGVLMRVKKLSNAAYDDGMANGEERDESELDQKREACRIQEDQMIADLEALIAAVLETTELLPRLGAVAEGEAGHDFGAGDARSALAGALVKFGVAVKEVDFTR